MKKKKKKSGSDTKGKKWKLRREILKKEAKLRLPPLRSVAGHLCGREQDVLQFAEAKAIQKGWTPKSHFFADVSQSIDRAPTGVNCCPRLSRSL